MRLLTSHFRNTSRRITLSLIAFSLFAFGQTASAEVFKNAYVSFQLPPNWTCKLEGTEWVCTSKFSKKAKEAIIILTAKEVGPADNISSYEVNLKSPRTVPSKSGTPTRSKVIKVSRKNIGNQQWVDGLQLGSEVDSYYTRYLATVKDRLAILVTFSAHQKHYTKYSRDFLAAINSIRVIAPKGLFGDMANNRIRPSTEALGAPIGGYIPTDYDDDEFPDEPTNSGDDMMIKLMALGLILVAGTMLFLRRGRKKKKKRRARR